MAHVPMWMKTPIFRVSVALVCLTASLIVTGDALLQFSGQQTRSVYENRRALCESLAVQYSALASRGALDVINATMQELVGRQSGVASTALRAADGRVLAQAGDHRRHWVRPAGDQSTLDHAQVPIFSGSERWGTLEVAFAQPQMSLLAQAWAHPLVRLLLFIGTVGFLTYLLFMRRTLRHLDPMAVVPERVRATLDVLAEGVLLVNAQDQIVLANAAFATRLNRPVSALIGRKASKLEWRRAESGEYPWVVALRDGKTQQGAMLEVEVDGGELRKFVVNSAPIVDGSGKVRGVVATFDDVTALERTNTQLRALTKDLESSQEKVTRQNVELKHLAARDSLTGCFNRRVLFEQLEAAWAAASALGTNVGCIMADIDWFKSVNDKYGHAVGDEVIQVVARVLGSSLRITDVLGRYGGEEFCIILPGMDAGPAAAVAERLRGAVEAGCVLGVRSAPGLRVTVSFGTASCVPVAGVQPAQLVDRADQALALAKQTGRNRVVRWDRVIKRELEDDRGAVPAPPETRREERVG